MGAIRVSVALENRRHHHPVRNASSVLMTVYHDSATAIASVSLVGVWITCCENHVNPVRKPLDGNIVYTAISWKQVYLRWGRNATI